MKYNVAVVFGGKSVEHEVSIITGLQLIEQMDPEKYRPIPVYLTKENAFYHAKAMMEIAYFKKRDLKTIEREAKRVFWLKEDRQVVLCTHWLGFLRKISAIDLVILAVHGTNCEDGTLAAFFELLDIPYVGSDVLSSSVAQNKAMTKLVLEKAGIPVIPYVNFFSDDYDDHREEVILSCERLGYPVIVKPAHLGSSVGVRLCRNRSELEEGITQALIYDDQVLVEKAIEEMREYNCAVLGNRTACEASLVEEVLKEDDILSYQDKYTRGMKRGSKGMASTRRLIPAPITETLTEAIRNLAEKTFITIGNSGIARIDFIYDEKNGKLYVNEINTIPGSFAYYLWDQKKRDFRRLIDDLIQIALYNYKRKENRTYTYNTNILSLEGQYNKLK